MSWATPTTLRGADRVALHAALPAGPGRRAPRATAGRPYFQQFLQAGIDRLPAYRPGAAVSATGRARGNRPPTVRSTPRISSRWRNRTRRSPCRMTPTRSSCASCASGSRWIGGGQRQPLQLQLRVLCARAGKRYVGDGRHRQPGHHPDADGNAAVACLAMLSISGAENQVQRYLMRCPSAPHDAREQGGTLNSAIRNDAITLMTQIALDLDQSLVPAGREASPLSGAAPWSTQEASFLITALANTSEIPYDVTQVRATIAAPDGTTEQSGDFSTTASTRGPAALPSPTAGPRPFIHFATEGILRNPDVPRPQRDCPGRGFTGKSRP